MFLYVVKNATIYDYGLRKHFMKAETDQIIRWSDTAESRAGNNDSLNNSQNSERTKSKRKIVELRLVPAPSSVLKLNKHETFLPEFTSYLHWTTGLERKV